ncbi:MAG: LD-carboxypeptidase [Oscillospiraceae bacterium]|jgi:muramoyltetrapeptide carboxypeptidase|nr:LD-carboxypeptidase [Oscillospiraceae bacterium]
MEASMIKPRALRPHSHIGIVGPSSPVDPVDLYAAKSALEAMGYRVTLGEGCVKAYGYLAAVDEIRAADLNRMFNDDGIDAVFCMRGGYGAMRLLDRLDYGAARKNPKPLLGFSDITALHISYGKFSNLVTFHGPMPVGAVKSGGLTAIERDTFDRSLKHVEPVGFLPSASPLFTLREGVAEGMLVGGNLSLVVGLLGTPYELDTAGRILLLEDVGEKGYAIDRMLTQLRLAGKLDDCAGIALGDYSDCGGPMRGHHLPLSQVFIDTLLPCGKPILGGFSIGHCANNVTLPLGVQARLDAGAKTLMIMENAVEG